MDVERANHWFGFKQVPNRFMHFLILRAVILLGILETVFVSEKEDNRVRPVNFRVNWPKMVQRLR